MLWLLLLSFLLIESDAFDCNTSTCADYIEHCLNDCDPSICNMTAFPKAVRLVNKTHAAGVYVNLCYGAYVDFAHGWNNYITLEMRQDTYREEGNPFKGYTKFSARYNLRYASYFDQPWIPQFYYRCYQKKDLAEGDAINIFWSGVTNNSDGELIVSNPYDERIQAEYDLFWEYDKTTRQLKHADSQGYPTLLTSGWFICDVRLLPFNDSTHLFPGWRYLRDPILHMCQFTNYTEFQPCPQACLRPGVVPSTARWRGALNPNKVEGSSYLESSQMCEDSSWRSYKIGWMQHEEFLQWSPDACLGVPSCTNETIPEYNGLWSNPITLDCFGQLYLANARFAIDIQSLFYAVEAASNFLTNLMGKCHCGLNDADAEALFGLDFEHVVRALDVKTQPSDYPNASCLENMTLSWKKLNQVAALMLHEDCSWASWQAGRGCQLSFHFPGTSLELRGTIDKCPGSRLPFLQLNITGGPFDDLFLPCQSDEDCLINTCDYIGYGSYADNAGDWWFDMLKIVSHWDAETDGETVNMGGTNFSVAAFIMSAAFDWVRTVYFQQETGMANSTAHPLKFCGVGHWLIAQQSPFNEHRTAKDPTGRLKQSLDPVPWFVQSLGLGPDVNIGNLYYTVFKNGSDMVKITKNANHDCSPKHANDSGTGRLCINITGFSGISNGKAVNENLKLSSWRSVDTLSGSVPDTGSALVTLLKTTCDGAFTLFPSTPFQRLAVYIKSIEPWLAQVADIMHALANGRRETHGEAHLDGFTFGQMYIPNPAMLLSVLNNINGTTFVPPDDLSSPWQTFTDWWNDWDIVSQSSFTGQRYIDMPETCTFERWKSEGKCSLKWSGLAKLFGGSNTNFDLHILLELDSCNEKSNFPALTLSCMGSNCEDVFKVADNDFCNQDSDCAGDLICQEPPDFPRIHALNWGYYPEPLSYYDILCQDYDGSRLADQVATHGSVQAFFQNVTETHRTSWGLIKSFPYKFTVTESNGMLAITLLPQSDDCDSDEYKSCYACGGSSWGNQQCTPDTVCFDYIYDVDHKTYKACKRLEYGYGITRNDEDACFRQWQKFGAPDAIWSNFYFQVDINGTLVRDWYSGFGRLSWSWYSDPEAPIKDCPLAKFAYAYAQDGLLKSYIGANTICTVGISATKLDMCTDKSYALDCGDKTDVCAGQARTNIEWMNMFHTLSKKPLLDPAVAINNPKNGFCFMPVDIDQAKNFWNNQVVSTDVYDSTGAQVAIKLTINDLYAWPPVEITEVDACVSSNCSAAYVCKDIKYPNEGWNSSSGYFCACLPGQCTVPCSSLKRQGTAVAVGCGDCLVGYKPDISSVCIPDDPDGCVANPCQNPDQLCEDCKYLQGASVNCQDGEVYYDPKARTCICPLGKSCTFTGGGGGMASASRSPSASHARSPSASRSPAVLPSSSNTGPDCDRDYNRVRNPGNLGHGTQLDTATECFPPVAGCGCCKDLFAENADRSNHVCVVSSLSGVAERVPSMNVLLLAVVLGLMLRA